MTDLFAPLTLACGAVLPNRFALAPLTNLQSHADGRLSDEEYIWLTKRAEGGFGLVMTCASHVQQEGLGFPGQLGDFSDELLPGLTRLAAGVKAHGAHAVVQLHHAGMRTPSNITGRQALCPSDNAETGARAMTLEEVKGAIAAFVAGAVRAERAGFDGVELHGAHGYLIGQFLSSEINQRTDEYGGALENRARFLFEAIDGVRAQTRPGFSLGVRLSPERFGMVLGEMRDIAQRLMSEGKIDYLDMSLWDTFKEPAEQAYKGRTLLSCFTDLRRGRTALGAAGKLSTAADLRRAMDDGLDFVFLGRSAILHHDFPKKMRANPDFAPLSLPVSAAHLAAEGLSPKFVNYMRTWAGFVEPAPA